jgi:hypothetical protein
MRFVRVPQFFVQLESEKSGFLSVLQHGGQTPIILREVVAPEIERSRHMALFEEH